MHICGHWQWHIPHVRPIMTTEARDILDRIHETIGAETRSDSIVRFMEKYTEMEVELCSTKLRWSRELNRANNNERLLTESRKQEAKVRCQNVLLKKKAQEYKVFTCVSMLTAIAALVLLTLGVK